MSLSSLPLSVLSLLWLSSLFPSCQHPLFWPLLFPLLRLLRPNGQTRAGNKVGPPSFSRHRDRQERKEERRERSKLLDRRRRRRRRRRSLRRRPLPPLLRGLPGLRARQPPPQGRREHAGLGLDLQEAASRASASAVPPPWPPASADPPPSLFPPRPPGGAAQSPPGSAPSPGPPRLPPARGGPLSTPPAAVPVKAPWRRSCPSSSRSTSR